MPVITRCSIPGCPACETFPTCAETFPEGGMPFPDGAPTCMRSKGWRGVMHDEAMFYFCPEHVNAVEVRQRLLHQHAQEEDAAVRAFRAAYRVEHPEPPCPWTPWTEDRAVKAPCNVFAANVIVVGALLVIGSCVLPLLFPALRPTEAKAAELRHAAVCGVYDENSDAWSHDHDCIPLERTIDCEAGMVCYAGNAGLFCEPVGNTTLPYNRLCRER